MNTETTEGIPVIAEPPRWLCGPALLNRGWIILDEKQSRQYRFVYRRRLLFDLASIRYPRDALNFVEAYGLLRHGPGADVLREPLTDFEREAAVLSSIMRRYYAMTNALRGHRDAIALLREPWELRRHRFSQPPTASDRDVLVQTSKVITLLINDGLVGTHEALGSSAVIFAGEPDDFFFIARPPHLLGYAYHQLATLVMSHAQLAACQECGQSFSLEDKRQRYCSTRCGNRARHRRWVEKKRAAGQTEAPPGQP